MDLWCSGLEVWHRGLEVDKNKFYYNHPILRGGNGIFIKSFYINFCKGFLVWFSNSVLYL